ncbi:hypothetical protein EIJ81_00760 (plasmid) [Aliivibrio salmonicida]|uniref:hypothetical protein n=1 Tax=Aliivibrio salmonicida TaxID=40269 RepID=UPI000F6E24C9|nr:hypothetical protein [Aliivibrio salmonicida]AZL83430.1 hypothetical protein EIJ81_00760 [Aliivibrio salmonicida]
MEFTDSIKIVLNKAIAGLDLTDISMDIVDTIPIYALFINSILVEKRKQNIDPDILLAALTDTYLQFIMSIKVVNDHENSHDADHNLQLENILHDINVGISLSPSMHDQHSLLFDELCRPVTYSPILDFVAASKVVRTAIAVYGYKANSYRNGNAIEVGEVPFSMLTAESLSITDMVHSLLITVLVLSQLLRRTQSTH